MLRHFIACIRSGGLSASEGIVGWNALAVIDAATASSRSGRREPVKVREMAGVAA
jgi:hypothetical protein